MNKEDEDARKDGEKKANGVMIDAVPTVIIDVPDEDKPSSRRGSLRFRGNTVFKHVHFQSKYRYTYVSKGGFTALAAFLVS